MKAAALLTSGQGSDEGLLHPLNYLDGTYRAKRISSSVRASSSTVCSAEILSALQHASFPSLGILGTILIRGSQERTMGLFSGLLGHASDMTPEKVMQELDGILLPDEPVKVAFKVIRDLFVFTDRRMILVDKQGITGRKVEFLTIPYRAITAYSIENAGSFDMDSELKIWLSGRPQPIEKTLKRGANIRGIQAAIASSL